MTASNDIFAGSSCCAAAAGGVASVIFKDAGGWHQAASRKEITKIK